MTKRHLALVLFGARALTCLDHVIQIWSLGIFCRFLINKLSVFGAVVVVDNIIVIIVVTILADKRRTRVQKWTILIAGAHTSRVTCMAPRRRLQFDLKL